MSNQGAVVTREEQGGTRGRIIAKAWTDEGFKRRLVSNPEAVLGEDGLALPAGVRVKVLENTDTLLHLVIPPKASEELAGQELATPRGGGADTGGDCVDRNVPQWYGGHRQPRSPGLAWPFRTWATPRRQGMPGHKMIPPRPKRTNPDHLARVCAEITGFLDVVGQVWGVGNQSHCLLY